jgi:hypothetical protein
LALPRARRVRRHKPSLRTSWPVKAPRWRGHQPREEMGLLLARFRGTVSTPLQNPLTPFSPQNRISKAASQPRCAALSAGVPSRAEIDCDVSHLVSAWARTEYGGRSAGATNRPSCYAFRRAARRKTPSARLPGSRGAQHRLP